MMLLIAQRMPEEPWHLVLRSDEGGVTALCGEASLPYGWWRRRSSPIRAGESPDGLCEACTTAVQEALGVDAGAVGDTMDWLSNTLESVQPAQDSSSPTRAGDLLPGVAGDNALG